mgnify:CR=1 FL=1
MQAKIRAILERLGEVPAAESLPDDADLYAAGLSSYGTVELMVALESEFAVEFPDGLLTRATFGSVGALAAGGLLDDRHEVLGGVVDDDVGAELVRGREDLLGHAAGWAMAAIPPALPDAAFAAPAADSRLLRTGMLTALAIAIHNFPEGFATFAAALGDPSVAVAITVAIALHNIPEGIAVAVPVRRATGSRRKAFAWAAFTGIAEPLGALIGWLLLAPFLTPALLAAVFAAVADLPVPRIHFGVGTGELLPAMSEAGAEVMGVDYRVPMDAAAERVSARVLQGNLDPAMLFAGDDAVRQAVRTIRGEVDRARERGDIDGHIWNLGHGVLPTTDAEAITRAVSIIHEEG